MAIGGGIEGCYFVGLRFQIFAIDGVVGLIEIQPYKMDRADGSSAFI
jgi:hypothetical protein